MLASFSLGSTPRLDPLPEWLGNVLVILFYLSLLLAQVYRYIRVSTAMQRQQTKWVLFGVTVFLVATIWNTLVPILVPTLDLYRHPSTTSAIYTLLSTPLFGLTYLLIPLSIGFSILRYRLWDIDVLINRALVYTILTGTLVAVYIGSVVFLQGLLRPLTGQGNELTIVVSTLLIAALFLPLRTRIQQVIDRRFYRRRYDAAKTLAAFTRATRDEVDLGRLTEQLVSVVEDTMQPAYVTLWLRTPGPRS